MSKIVLRDPFRGLSAWPKWMEDFDESFSNQRGLKIQDTGDAIVAEAVVAGVPADDVEVTIEDGVVTIKAETKVDEKKKNVTRTSSYQYYYTAALSGGNWEKADAHVEHGVVKVTIPKAEAIKPRKIKVKSK